MNCYTALEVVCNCCITAEHYFVVVVAYLREILAMCFIETIPFFFLRELEALEEKSSKNMLLIM